MKLINKLDETVEKSLYSGQSTRSNEMYLRPVPKFDENGKELKKSERYYVFRLLYFTGEDRNYPFIVRDEHTFIKRDFSGNVKEIKRICCPNTLWAKKKIQEKVDRDYCPICKFSFEQNSEGWKNFKTLGQIDDTCLKIAKETKSQWAAYLPVLVISDPLYKNNNNHFRVLRLAGDDGKAAFMRIKEMISEANKLGISVFNGEEGANIAMLCEKMQKISMRKNGEPIIDKETGEPKTYNANCITDVQLMSKRLHSYSIVTEANLEKLAFDETYGVAATKEQLQAFLSENYLDNGASDSDFDEEFGSEDDFGGEIKKNLQVAKKNAVTEEEDDEIEDESEAETDDFEEDEESETENDVDEADIVDEDEETEEDDDDEFADESPRDAIARITKGRVSTAQSTASKKVAAAVMDSVATSKKTIAAKTVPVKKSTIKMKSRVELPKDKDSIRDSSLDIDPDDLPF